jgi:hypothetical protein
MYLEVLYKLQLSKMVQTLKVCLVLGKKSGRKEKA